MAEMPDVTEVAGQAQAPAAVEGQPIAEGTATPAAVSPTPSPSNVAAPMEEPKFEIKVGGKTEILTREEIIARAQRDTDYTRKTQQLADERRRWEADRDIILKQEVEKRVRELQEQQQRQALQQQDPAKYALDRTQLLEQQMDSLKLEIALKNVLGKHSEVSEKDFLIAANAKGLKDADDVAKLGDEIAAEIERNGSERFDSRFKEIISSGNHPELKAFKEKVIADYLKTKTSGPAPLTEGKGSVPAGLDGPKKPRTIEEASDIAMEMLTGSPPA